jgi:hypothetical protein
LTGLLWVETRSFEGWGCAECPGIFHPSDAVIGNTSMK